MNSYTRFRKVIGIDGQKLANAAGYTRVGLFGSFSMVDIKKLPSKKFIVCMKSVITTKKLEEINKFQKRMAELDELESWMNEVNDYE